jgi:hypothetical protein
MQRTSLAESFCNAARKVTVVRRKRSLFLEEVLRKRAGPMNLSSRRSTLTCVACIDCGNVNGVPGHCHPPQLTYRQTIAVPGLSLAPSSSYCHLHDLSNVGSSKYMGYEHVCNAGTPTTLVLVGCQAMTPPWARGHQQVGAKCSRH